jgi:hypothetical protein
MSDQAITEEPDLFQHSADEWDAMAARAYRLNAARIPTGKF